MHYRTLVTRETQFSADDHRAFNRHGESFDRGETFSGLDFDLQLSLVDRLKPFVPEGATLAQFALRWILDFDAVTTVIPGRRRVTQVDDNVRASDLPRLSEQVHAQNRRALHQRRAAARASLLAGVPGGSANLPITSGHTLITSGDELASIGDGTPGCA